MHWVVKLLKGKTPVKVWEPKNEFGVITYLLNRVDILE